VALDLPTSWIMTTGNGDEFTARMFDAIIGMLSALILGLGLSPALRKGGSATVAY